MNQMQTERLILRRADDKRDGAHFVHMLRADGDFQDYTGFPLSEELIRCFEHYFITKDCYYTVFKKESDSEMIGYVGISFQNGAYEVETYISRPERNCGYCTEALSKLIDEYFKREINVLDAQKYQEELDRLYGKYLPGNGSIERVLEKLGFVENKERYLFADLYINPETEEITELHPVERVLTKDAWEKHCSK